MTAKTLKMRATDNSINGSHFTLPINGLLLITLLLLVIGLMMMTSASIEISSSQFGDPLYHLKRQSLFAAMGFLTILNQGVEIVVPLLAPRLAHLDLSKGTCAYHPR